MTASYLETNFPLAYGLKIDELDVRSFSEEHTPYEFYLKQTLQLKECPDASGSIRNVIFFDRPNADYYWQSDSTWGIFDISIIDYKYRGNLSKKSRWDNSYQKQYDIYPSAFKPNSWYLVDFKPVGEKHREFLHVDQNNNFVFYRLKNVGE